MIERSKDATLARPAIGHKLAELPLADQSSQSHKLVPSILIASSPA